MPLSLPPNPCRRQSVNAKRGIIAQFFPAIGNVDIFPRSISAAVKKCPRQKMRVALPRSEWPEYCGPLVGDKPSVSVAPCHMTHKNIFAKRLPHGKLPLCLMDGLGGFHTLVSEDRKSGVAGQR